jgi:hypothetical protein
MRDLARRYSRYLLRARVSTEESGVGFYSASNPQSIDTEVSLRAGLALVDAYEVTRDAALRDTIVGLTTTVSSAAFGWVSYRGGAGLVDPDAPKSGVDVARTSLAAALLSRAAVVADTPTGPLAAQALRTLARGQAAVGRWYARLPSGSPMNLHQWATTLAGLQSLRNSLAQGILGGGVPALYEAVFRSKGEAAKNPLTKGDTSGLALSYGVLARYPDERFSSAAFPKLVGGLRENGTVSLAPAGDAQAQALYASAIAAEVAAIKDDR